MFYFSGHGVPSQQSGKVFLASTEIDVDHPIHGGYAMSRLTDVMNECKSKRMISMLDCCFAGDIESDNLNVLKSNEEARVTKAKVSIDNEAQVLKEGVGKVFLCASLGSQQAQNSLKLPYASLDSGIG